MNNLIFKISFLTIIFSIFSFAQSSIFTKFTNEFNKAKVIYNKHNYKDAYLKFIKLSEEAPDNPEVNFYLGRCALELKRYDEAMAAFDRVLIINPNHIRTKLEIARIYFETKQYDLAETELDLVLKEDIPESVKKNILKFKANIQNRKTTNFVSSSVSFGFDYDSNANNDIGNVSFLIPAFDIYVDGKPKSSDTSAFLSASLMDIYYFRNNREWSLNSIATIYSKANKEYSQNNSLMISLSTTPTYTKKRYKLSFPININKVFLDGEGYSHNIKLGASLIYGLDASSSITTLTNFSRTYNERDSKEDSKTYSIGLTYKKIFEIYPITMQLSTNYSKTEEIDPTRTDINSDTIRYSMKLSKELIKNLICSLTYTKSKKSYEDIDVLFSTKREDDQDSYNIVFTYNITKTFLLRTSLTYLDNSSNQAPFNYDKSTLNVTFTKSF